MGRILDTCSPKSFILALEFSEGETNPTAGALQLVFTFLPNSVIPRPLGRWQLTFHRSLVS